MKFTFSKFIKDQRTKVPPVATSDLTGRTVIVTGANSGLGFEAAKHVARMHPGKLILACRSREKGEKALAELKMETGCDTAELRLLDLADFASVKSFAIQFEKEKNRLDILLENAGVFPPPKTEFTKDGWEQSVQVNDLSPSLLALLLLPILLDTADKYGTIPRLVVVTSELHYWAKFDKKLIDSPQPFRLLAHKDYLRGKTGSQRYPETKLLNVLFARALSDRLRQKSLIVNSVSPGFCISEFRRTFSGFQSVVNWLMEKTLARSTEEGSRQLVWAAVGGADKLDDLRGAYISLATVEESSDYVISQEGRQAQTKLWEALVEELIKIEPKIREIVQNYLSAPL
ncbi:hypothetical protein HYPSUDRAFT_33824 [Hypholoma sublateritium FD-334 SS-4]|uniref:WW domain-containing oxidoreductase n=1 Tax=Hypholoma sublateritium (strain FD-334 SS-4) TaxID=945553 RepID=A0A0D2PIZ4_HYPSF|nr:hypothetical protein HYPSUDRAFT_33824 [Hypholoma sublateritium FD-334 SS-4]